MFQVNDPAAAPEDGRDAPLCYICAMRLSGLAAMVVVLASLQAPALLSAQFSGGLPAASQDPAAAQPAQPAQQNPTQQNVDGAAAKPDCNGVPCEYPEPHITVANPPPAAPVAAAWTLPERISWAANLVLVLMGYAGIMMAISTMRKIERQTRLAETMAEAALSAAQAAQLSAQAIVDAERPWIIVTSKPSQTAENSFTIVATNRGRTPARIVAMAERTRIAVDESQLPELPDYESEEASAPLVPIILLPGESTALKPFSRADVRGLCASDEDFKRIESWEEKIYIYGKVVYRDLIAPADRQAHQTDWCCWYIHGRQRSGLVIAGPAEYNKHT